MSSGYLDVTCVLIPPDPNYLTAGWSCWCPELDVWSCGLHADHAIVMLAEAVTMCAEDDLARFDWGRASRHLTPEQQDAMSDGEHRAYHTKRVSLRRPVLPFGEEWEGYQRFKQEGPDGSQGSQSFRSTCVDQQDGNIGVLDTDPGVAYVTGLLSWDCRSGCLVVRCEFSDQAFVERMQTSPQ